MTEIETRQTLGTELNTSERHWTDRYAKIIMPIVGGIVIGLLGLFTQHILGNIASKQENARLITQLQLQREQGESNLRRDIFDQAIAALLSEDDLARSDLSPSKRLMKLELLAHNFGGSLNLSPLFVEFNRDLDQLELGSSGNPDLQILIGSLRKRLRGLAKRVASKQISALAQAGWLVDFNVNLSYDGREFKSKTAEYKWPEDQARALVGWDIADESTNALLQNLIEEEKRELGRVTFEKVTRHVLVTLSNPNPELKTVDVDLEICQIDLKTNERYDCESESKGTVNQEFQLDYFNFPKIDNTRLSNNQRFSIVLEEFDTDADDARIKIAAIIFPAEYASLKDRPSMREAVQLLDSVLNSND